MHLPSWLLLSMYVRSVLQGEELPDQNLNCNVEKEKDEKNSEIILSLIENNDPNSYLYIYLFNYLFTYLFNYLFGYLFYDYLHMYIHLPIHSFQAVCTYKNEFVKIAYQYFKLF